MDNFNTILNITDEHIIVNDMKLVKVNDHTTAKVFYGTQLLPKDEKCPSCGIKHNDYSIHSHRPSSIKMLKTVGYETYLNLDKIRYKCNLCNKTHTPQSSIVKRGCFIATDIKRSILFSLQEERTMKSIVKDYNVSSHTGFRVLDNYADSLIHRSVYRNYLPSVIHFDEFKSTRDAKGNMSFIMIDGLSHKIIDILENRTQNYLLNAFKYYHKKARRNVKYVVMDMYSPYISLVNKVFVNAKIVFDRFHIAQNLTRAFNKTRIDIMNNDKVNYNKFKNYWKIFLKPKNNLSYYGFKSACFSYRFMTPRKIVDYLRDNNQQFKYNYDFYQRVLSSLRYKKPNELLKLIKYTPNYVSDKLKTCLNTFDEYQEYIINSMKVEWNNGVIEGTISKIKRLKTICCGFNKYFRFKTRIMLIFNLTCES